MTITRDTMRTSPVTTTEAKVIQGRIGSFNTAAVDDHGPYTLKLLKVSFRAEGDGWVMTETWETANQ